MPSYDGDVYHNHADSNNKHDQTYLGNFLGSPMAVGSRTDRSNKAEIYNITINEWADVTAYPYYTE